MLRCVLRACSFANGRAWVYDSETSTWKGYKLSFEAPKPKPAAAARTHSQQRAAADAVHGAPDSGLAVPQAGVGGDKETCPLAVE